MAHFRFMTFLAALALLISPFGRMAAAETMTHSAPAAADSMAQQEMGSMAGHCDDMAPGDGETEGAMIDCMIACATLMPADTAQAAAAKAELIAPLAVPALFFDGIQLEAEPPPPRLS